MYDSKNAYQDSFMVYCATNEEGVNFANHTAVMIVDTTPFVGNFLEAFMDISKQSNAPIKYVPIFADEGHQEWFVGYYHQELTKKFLRDELKLPNVTRLLSLLKWTPTK